MEASGPISIPCTKTSKPGSPPMASRAAGQQIMVDNRLTSEVQRIAGLAQHHALGQCRVGRLSQGRHFEAVCPGGIGQDSRYCPRRRQHPDPLSPFAPGQGQRGQLGQVVGQQNAVLAAAGRKGVVVANQGADMAAGRVGRPREIDQLSSRSPACLPPRPHRRHRRSRRRRAAPRHTPRSARCGRLRPRTGRSRSP